MINSYLLPNTAADGWLSYHLPDVHMYVCMCVLLNNMNNIQRIYVWLIVECMSKVYNDARWSLNVLSYSV